MGLRRRLRVVVVHAPCVPTTTTYSLRIYRCPYYVFTDARTTTTTYLPMYVLHTYRFYLLLLCTDVPTTTHRAGRMPECSPLGRPTNKRSVLANTQYLLTEPGACPSALLWADLLINVRSSPILNTYSPSRARARGGTRRTAARGEGHCAPAPA